jgi:7-cyano-7-deazaguanine reductase
MSDHASKRTVKTFWDIDSSILKSIPNPTNEAYEVKIKIPEFTFLGVKEQPDFAVLYLTFYPGRKVVELKSLKQYVYQLRDIIISYERLINIFYNDLMKMYQPERLRLVMVCNPRGGISSKLTIDSDWKIRGGTERFNDWKVKDEWNITM